MAGSVQPPSKFNILSSYRIDRMAKQLNPDVTTFLDELNHPFRKEIETLRSMIIKADLALTKG